MPRISVIVPVYKVEKYIHRCVDSILGQTYADFELILVDDGSPDRCGEICDRYATKDSRVVVIHKKNGGVSSARNAGLDAAKGKYITFVDSDDWIHPDFLQNGIAACEQQSLDLYCSGFARVYPDGTEQKSVVSKPIEGYTDALPQKEIVELLEQNYIASSVVKLIRRELLTNLRFDTRIAWGEDLKFIFSLFNQHCKIYAEPRMDYYYRVGHTSATASTSLQKCNNIAQTYADLYSLISERGFGIGTYSRFIDWRCWEDLLYTEQLVMKSRVPIIEKRKMIAALMKLRQQIPFMEHPALIRHIKLYSKCPCLLIFRNSLLK